MVSISLIWNSLTWAGHLYVLWGIRLVLTQQVPSRLCAWGGKERYLRRRYSWKKCCCSWCWEKEFAAITRPSHCAQDCHVGRTHLSYLCRFERGCSYSSRQSTNWMPITQTHCVRSSNGWLYHSAHCRYSAEIHTIWRYASFWYLDATYRLQSKWNPASSVSNRTIGHVHGMESDCHRSFF